MVPLFSIFSSLMLKESVSGFCPIATNTKSVSKDPFLLSSNSGAKFPWSSNILVHSTVSLLLCVPYQPVILPPEQRGLLFLSPGLRIYMMCTSIVYLRAGGIQGVNDWLWLGEKRISQSYRLYFAVYNFSSAHLGDTNFSAQVHFKSNSFLAFCVCREK